LIAMVFTVRLLRSVDVNLNLQAPDGAAGLGPLGELLTFPLLIATSLGATAIAIHEMANLFMRWSCCARRRARAGGVRLSRCSQGPMRSDSRSWRDRAVISGTERCCASFGGP